MSDLRAIVKSILLEFPWVEYDLEQVEHSRGDEWASDLAGIITEAAERQPS